MEKQSCEQCAFRAKYDNNPKSVLGRIWKWHIGFCPGWKAYMESLEPAKRVELAAKYQIKKYM